MNTSSGFPASRKIRESQGEIYFSGKSGNLFHFLGFRENQGIIVISAQWSGKVKEFVLIQVKHCVIFYVLYQNKRIINQIFLASLCSAF